MKSKKDAVGLIALCLLVVANVQGGWEWLAEPPQVGADPGSALCAGIATVNDTTRNCVWFLHSVKCAPGPVKLSIMDAAGRKLASLSAESQNREVDITYNHPVIQSGVYFWKVSTASGDANGKMVIAR